MSHRGQRHDDRGASSTGASPVSFDRAVVDDVGAYCDVMAAVDTDRWRAGTSSGTTSVASLRADGVTFEAARLGFRMNSRATIPDDHVVFVHVSTGPPSTRYCDFDTGSGAVVAYGPGSLHTSNSPAGSTFEYATARIDDLREVASEMHVELELLEPGVVVLLTPSRGRDRLAATFRDLHVAAGRGAEVPRFLRDSLAGDLVGALASTATGRRYGSPRRIDSRAVVHRCIDFAESVGRLPTLQELCVVGQVSERRLRQAFTSEFDQPPTQFFRQWALAAARRRLSLEARHVAVTDVATDLGFSHLGRFAGEYRKLFGETPSSTVRAQRA